MKFTRKILISFIFSLLLVYLSFNFSIVPCKKVHNIISVPSSWDFCSFSFTTGKTISENLYFGRYLDPLKSVLYSLAFSFVAIFLTITLLSRKRKIG
ncbi:MAG: hypothetical protein QXX68_01635 [Candidatus Pacearchaeota archaeon]